MNYLFLIILLVSQSHILISQSVKDEKVEYQYIQLPAQPLPPSIKNYQVEINMNYLEENNNKRVEYEAAKLKAQQDFELAQKEYPARVKEAEETYAKEMEEWKKKSLGDKIIEKQVLNENNKPVKRIPSEPRLGYVPEPKLKTEYNMEELAKTYIQLGGYANEKSESVQIFITIFGFDYTQPVTHSLVKDMMKVSNGKSQSYKETYYYNEFTYRHTMSVRVVLPDGKEILNASPQELNNYKIYKTNESTTAPPLNVAGLVSTYERKIIAENLIFVNNWINDKYGYHPVDRKFELSYVKAKDETYSDILVAFNEASVGFKTLISDSAAAQTKLRTCIQTWEKALAESDVQNKKARINKDITIALAFNLLEAYFALHNPKEGERIIALLNTIDISKNERKRKEEFETLFKEIKKRKTA